MTTTETPNLIDLGPAPSAPSWCLPGTQPNTASPDSGLIWTWSRDFGDYVWISCEDRVVDGRLVRMQPVLEVDLGLHMFVQEHAKAIGERLIEAHEVYRAAMRDYQS